MKKIEVLSQKLKKKLALLNICLAIKNNIGFQNKFWASKINDILTKFIG